MKFIRSILLISVTALLAGCDTFYQDSRYHQDTERQEALRTEMARQQQARDLDLLRSRGETLDYRLLQFESRLEAIEKRSESASAVPGEINALRREMEELRKSQANLRSEIVDELGREINKILAQEIPARGTTTRTSRQTGYEHKVQAGQTLSEIATAYQVTVDAIKQANKLKSDVIRVGQTLFIPD